MGALAPLGLVLEPDSGPDSEINDLMTERQSSQGPMNISPLETEKGYKLPGKQDFFRNLQITLVINLTITLVIYSVLGFQKFWLVFVAANSIGLSCFAVSWATMVWIFRHPPCESLAATLGVQPLGALVGSMLAHPLLQAHQPYLQTLAMALVFALPSGLVVYLISRLGQSRLKNKALEAEEARARQRATAMELKTLQNQIEPHFLFNTLANVSALIDLDPVRARKLIGRYSDFLRDSMRVSGIDSWTLREELEMVEHYLCIQQMRFPAIRFQVELPEHWALQQIPPLLIQPLVENAYEHGLKPVGHAGKILIRVWLDIGSEQKETALVIDVIDSGSGYTAKPFVKLKTGPEPSGRNRAGARSSAETTGNGLAIDNIRARLSHLYGAKAELILVNITEREGSIMVESAEQGQSWPETGTLARIRLPVDEKLSGISADGKISKADLAVQTNPGGINGTAEEG